MKWLLTVPSGVDLDELTAELSAIGCERTGADPICLGHDMVLSVEAARDLPQRLREAGVNVTRVNPSSEVGLHFAAGPA